MDCLNFKEQNTVMSVKITKSQVHVTEEKAERIFAFLHFCFTDDVELSHAMHVGTWVWQANLQMGAITCDAKTWDCLYNVPINQIQDN